MADFDSVLRNHRRSRGLLALPRRRRHQAPRSRRPSKMGQSAEMGQRALRRPLRARQRTKKRALHTSNSYKFFDPGETAIPQFPPKSKIPTRALNQDFTPDKTRPATPQNMLPTSLELVLQRSFDLLSRKNVNRAYGAVPLRARISHTAKFEPHRRGYRRALAQQRRALRRRQGRALD